MSGITRKVRRSSTPTSYSTPTTHGRWQEPLGGTMYGTSPPMSWATASSSTTFIRPPCLKGPCTATPAKARQRNKPCTGMIRPGSSLSTELNRSSAEFMRCVFPGFVLLSAGFLFFSNPFNPAAPTPGFGEELSAAQIQREKQFDDMLRADNIRELMKRLAARPQHLGSPYRKENAAFIRAKFQEWGFDARLETFDVLFPTPKVRILEMTEPVAFRASLDIPSVEYGPAGVRREEILPSYNGYFVGGDVTAPLVYVNYGTREDYVELERRGGGGGGRD